MHANEIQGPLKLIIVVVYGMDVLTTHTTQSLLQGQGALQPGDLVYIWDNSPQPQQPGLVHALVSQLPCAMAYEHTPENISLATIYNTVIRRQPAFDLVFFFDQDSGFDAGYFEQVVAAASRHPEINLFLPLIYNGNTIVSPGHFFYFKGRYWSQPQTGIVAAKNNVAITSGMAVRMPYLQSFGGFEERLQLYGIDTNFMIRYARDNASFYVVPVRFDHDLSDFNEESSAVKNRRFEQFKTSSLINASLFPLPVQWLTRLFLWYRSLLHNIKHN